MDEKKRLAEIIERTEGHTVSPWEADSLHHIWRRYVDNQGRRCAQPLAEVVRVSGHEEEQGPNARLMAAAPELREIAIAQGERIKALEAERNVDRADGLRIAAQAERIEELEARLGHLGVEGGR